MTRSRHYTKVAMALQPPLIDSRVPQVMESEFLYSGFFASGDKSFLKGAHRTASIRKHYTDRRNHGQPYPSSPGKIISLAGERFSATASLKEPQPCGMIRWFWNRLPGVGIGA